MELGIEVRVRIVERLSDRKVRVLDVDSGNTGVLWIKGDLRIRTDGTIKAWLMRRDEASDTYIYGNAFFGKYSIVRAVADSYVVTLKKLYDNPEALVPDDVSRLKGMVNRCIKMDQWDWFTTFKYLGYPSRSVLERFVADAVIQRDLLRKGRYEALPRFRADHHTLLSSMLFHLSEDMEVAEEDVDVPIPGLGPDQWALLSFESRRNIKMAERTNVKSSVYSFMHYFVALEQEFKDHLVVPFTTSYRGGSPACSQDKYQRTNDLLIGKSLFTLGSVGFLGGFVASSAACEASEAIRKFSEFLGGNKMEFAAVCSLIASELVGGTPLPMLRNALAHGNADVLSRLREGAFSDLRSLLFEPPRQVIPRILAISAKAGGPASSSGM